MTQLLLTQIKEQFAQEEGRKKDTFWASDCETPLFDLYHKFLGTEPTNPIEPEKLVMFKAAKMMEVAIVNELKKTGQIIEPEGEQHYFRIPIGGITMSGSADALMNEEEGKVALEIKTYYGDYQTKELQAGKPKTSYLKQLACYMYAFDCFKGYLVYMERGTGQMFQFVLNREKTLFKCMNIEFDLQDTFDRWTKFWFENVLQKVEPSPFECGEYKADIEKIDWKKVSKGDIAKARAGTKVIGSDPENGWKILYSPYKNLIIERQGSTPGYTEAELKQIKEATKGYSGKSFNF